MARVPFAAAQTSAEDSVTGTAATGNGLTTTVDVHSGPSGEHPRGTLTADTPAIRFDFVVVCLNVTGNTALVGANFTGGGPEVSSALSTGRPTPSR